MAIRKINFVNNESYHIYNRGNGKQKIFLDPKDYWRFIDLLYAINTTNKFNFSDSLKGIPIYERAQDEPLVSIEAYCLMPNHFHIVISPLSENGISIFMQKISTAYVMYFNEKYNRTGSLFEGKFKAEHLNTDRYLKYIFSYVHLNPIKLKQSDWKESGIKNKKSALEYLNTYEYSSFLDYQGIKRQQNKILKLKTFQGYFVNKKDILNELMTWLTYHSNS